LLGARLNILALGDDHAESLGVDATSLRRWTLAGVSLATGTAVAVSGIIGFVGLLVPLAVRLLVGPDLRRVIPLAAITGAVFLVAVDALGRTVLAPREIRLGIICSVVGAPVFLTMLFRSPSWTARH
jgi:iron complex transport system permease protein